MIDWLLKILVLFFYILSSKTFLQTIFLYISKNYNDPLYIAIMSKFGQLSMHACMNQIATLISKNEREVLKKNWPWFRGFISLGIYSLYASFFKGIFKEFCNYNRGNKNCCPYIVYNWTDATLIQEL